MPIVQLLAVLILAGLGYAAGQAIARWPAGKWWGGFGLFLLMIAVVAIGRRSVVLSFVPPFSWVTKASVNYLLMAFLCTGIFAVLIPKLPMGRERRLVGWLAIVFVLFYSVMPIIMPVAVRPQLAQTPGVVDRDGVCRQTLPYTCGPAAAVTALSRMGIQSSEGELAIEAGTWPGGGTDPDALAATMNTRLAPTHRHAAYGYFNSLQQIAHSLPAVAMIRGGPLNDHYVTVLSMTPRVMILGDPWNGQIILSPTAFAKVWTGTAITVEQQ